jgi:hypothetical protein
VQCASSRPLASAELGQVKLLTILSLLCHEVPKISSQGELKIVRMVVAQLGRCPRGLTVSPLHIKAFWDIQSVGASPRHGVGIPALKLCPLVLPGVSNARDGSAEWPAVWSVTRMAEARGGAWTCHTRWIWHLGKSLMLTIGGVLAGPLWRE